MNNIGHGQFARLFGLLILIDLVSTLAIVHISSSWIFIIGKYLVLGVFVYGSLRMGQMILVQPEVWSKLHREMAYNCFLERINRILVSDLDFQQVFEKFLQELQSEVDFDYALVYRVEETCGQYAPYLYGDRQQVISLDKPFGAIEDSFLEPILPGRQPLLITDLHTIGEVRELNNKGVQALMMIPMLYQNTIQGMLLLASCEPDSYQKTPLNFLKPVIERLTISLENCILYEKTKELSLKDYLTGCPNRRALDIQLDYEHRRAKRYQEPFSILALDIDHFKKLNDRYGHLVGDDILQELAQLMRLEVRDIDLVSRFGGEEFVILLPETSHEEAAHVAERVRRRVAEHTFLQGKENVHVTVSVGVATYSEEMDGIKELLQGADLKLYSAKEGGRNQVVHISPCQETAVAAGD